MIPAVSPMRLEDVPACLMLVEQAWGERYVDQAQDDLRDMFRAHRYAPTYYIARDADEMIGLAGHAPSNSKNGFHGLLWVVVRADRRGFGVGTVLVRRCLKDIDALGAATTLTTRVPEFYRPFEFEPVSGDLMLRPRRALS